MESYNETWKELGALTKIYQGDTPHIAARVRQKNLWSKLFEPRGTPMPYRYQRTPVPFAVNKDSKQLAKQFLTRGVFKSSNLSSSTLPGTEKGQLDQMTTERDQLRDEILLLRSTVDLLQSTLKKTREPCFLSHCRDQLDLPRQYVYCNIGDCDKDNHTCEYVPCSESTAKCLSLWVGHMPIAAEGYCYYREEGDIWQGNAWTGKKRRIELRRPSNTIWKTLANPEFWEFMGSTWTSETSPWKELEDCLTAPMTAHKIPWQEFKWNKNRRNLSIFNAFCHERPHCNLQVLYHGVGDADPASVCEHGLLIHFSNNGVHSRGLYFAKDPLVCFQHYTKASRTILVCLVDVGRPSMEDGWQTDRLCVRNGQLQDSVEFTIQGSTCYVVPRNEQVLILGSVSLVRQ